MGILGCSVHLQWDCGICIYLFRGFINSSLVDEIEMEERPAV